MLPEGIWVLPLGMRGNTLFGVRLPKVTHRRTMPQTEPDYDARREAVNKRLREAGVSKADAARGIGYHTESGTAYVRQVLSGASTSAPVLDRIDAFLDKAAVHA